MELVGPSTESGVLDRNTTNSTTSMDYELPTWLMVLGRIQLIVAITGALLNISTFMFLHQAKSLNRMVSFLMKHQALLDFFVCLFGAIILLTQQEYMWKTGTQIIDIVVCYVWHSNMLYWWCFSLSVWSLVLLAIDRFMAVCKPFIYMNMTKVKMILCMVVIYASMISLTIPSSFYVIHFNNGQCEYRIITESLHFYSIFIFIASYFAPCFLIILLYVRIILSLRKRQNDGDNLGRSSVIDVATKQLTKSAAIVTTIFILTLGPSSLTLLVGEGIIELTLDSPVTKSTDFLRLFQRMRREPRYAVESTETSHI